MILTRYLKKNVKKYFKGNASKKKYTFAREDFGEVQLGNTIEGEFVIVETFPDSCYINGEQVDSCEGDDCLILDTSCIAVGEFWWYDTSNSYACEEEEMCLNGKCVNNHCSNGIIDADESDVDCGGFDCGGCANEMRCNNGADCASAVCIAEVPMIKGYCSPDENHVCIDGFDSGNDALIYGYAESSSDPGAQYFDACQDENTLIEYFCDAENLIGSEEINCNCNGGICMDDRVIPETAEGETNSDNTNANTEEDIAQIHEPSDSTDSTIETEDESETTEENSEEETTTEEEPLEENTENITDKKEILENKRSRRAIFLGLGVAVLIGIILMVVFLNKPK